MSKGQSEEQRQFKLEQNQKLKRQLEQLRQLKKIFEMQNNTRQYLKEVSTQIQECKTSLSDQKQIQAFNSGFQEIQKEFEQEKKQNMTKLSIQQKKLEKLYAQIEESKKEQKKLKLKVNQLENDLQMSINNAQTLNKNHSQVDLSHSKIKSFIKNEQSNKSRRNSISSQRSATPKTKKPLQLQKKKQSSTKKPTYSRNSSRRNSISSVGSKNSSRLASPVAKNNSKKKSNVKKPKNEQIQVNQLTKSIQGNQRPPTAVPKQKVNNQNQKRQEQPMLTNDVKIDQSFDSNICMLRQSCESFKSEYERVNINQKNKENVQQNLSFYSFHKQNLDNQMKSQRQTEMVKSKSTLKALENTETFIININTQKEPTKDLNEIDQRYNNLLDMLRKAKAQV